MPTSWKGRMREQWNNSGQLANCNRYIVRTIALMFDW
ncbi:predicted protein [Sclerotinia sclerotiorum 1980 UF-70]|uniref:Uncharacterized protein n=1 Tax=Sclerotinia sclerotiorum (strain ATCC 18683 / 1980 / Ss-1) TaxID=665079 RepID=A7EIM4_SCLS1|nr:predicted protein [Sclerotinia sclerotiorum 1980 UF-70]EDO02690.1 predicted protein [Sclerotinia sclerotiorum 1980 UF-70]